MRRIRFSAVLVVLLACVGCDHASKQAARSLLDGAPAFTLAGGAVRFELVSNPGAFLSLGAGLAEGPRRFILIVLVPALIALLCLYVLRSSPTSRGQCVAVGLLAGGGLGNWLDRLLHDGAVTDFVSVGIGPLRTGVFNLADVAIMAGIVLLLLSARQTDLQPGFPS